ncbi:CheY-like superfamily [Penicillium coprophilum]|uniref:CheY-like superfamily n=1 Tax=Penicillium coprophilum TaxID=36646 RepID=UPI0023905271|nr:CheY-like superfamily [Penicillium coprophilum]KAJ5154619.1 CheY-like superfamily [Penicillium coprophilum]
MSATRTSQDGPHNADRRARELYRYYQPASQPDAVPSWLSADDGFPFSANSGNTLTPPISEGSMPSRSSAASRPATAMGPDALMLGTSNSTMTSFAQLAALRLNAERVFIAVLDRDQQHIIAEATKSLNLNDPAVHDENDYLWLGAPDTRKTWSVCKDTVSLPPNDRENADYQFLVVDDLTENERYKDLSFVANDPKFRFFAGTPLTTEKNINLGCLFVLDKKPRDGLTSLEKDTLGSLSMIVVDYLRVCRQASEGRRAARLSRGLSYFVEGSSSFVDSMDRSRTDSVGIPSATPPSSYNRLSASGGSRGSPDSRGNGLENASQEPSISPPNNRALSTDARSFSSVPSDLKLDSDSKQSGSSRLDDSSKLDSGSKVESGTVESSLPEWLTSSSRNRLPPDDSQGNSWCFRRAANLLRESLDLSGDSGVIFLESNNSPLIDADMGSDCSDTGGPASVLSASTNEEPFAPQAGSMATCAAANLDRSFLQLLLRRYPKGKLWSFHRDGLLSTSDDDDQEPQDKGPIGTSTSSRSPPSVTAQPSKSVRKRRKAAENSILNQYFPNAAQIMFVPLWNAVSSQWFGGCFCWSTVETQVFTTSVELSSVLGFSSSIMAEYSRVESLIADRQKGDFIGSISHELRSPLHGILAAAEFMNSTHLNEFQDSLLETVNSCGRTLLDTMNQVLDFSKVVSLERTWRSMKRKKQSSLEYKGSDKLAHHLDTLVATDVAILVEEVVEGICLGHVFGQSSTASADLPVLMPHQTKLQNQRSNVEVVIDVLFRDWVYRTQPGALRRIIMNLFGNAMKYTESGRVTISLAASSQSEGRSRRQGLEDLVTLTVTDTGKGISEEFLRGKLYTPFAQEDALAVGTGLGLSIVRSLVKALNGSIRIRSRPGEGTVVQVSLPLERPVGKESPAIEPSGQLVQQREALAQTLLLREGYSGRRVSIWGADPTDVTFDSNWSEIARYLSDWYDMEIVAWTPETHVDIVLMDETDLPKFRTVAPSATLPALLVLCHKSMDYTGAKSEWLPLASSVNIIRRPCGPHKLARSVMRCLTQDQSRSVTPASAQKGLSLPLRTSSLPAPSALDSPVISSSDVISAPDLSFHEIRPMTISPLQQPSIITALPEEIAEAPLPAPLVEGGVSSSRLARVLVVDDNRINLNLMMTFLKKRQLIELTAAENGKLAVEAVERMQSGYDIIFMDMSMPVMNGFEATRAIRSLEKDTDDRKPAIIIALTGLSSSRDESDAMAAGVDLFLTKPVSFREVSRLLDEWEKDEMTAEQAKSF